MVAICTCVLLCSSVAAAQDRGSSPSQVPCAACALRTGGGSSWTDHLVVTNLSVHPREIGGRKMMRNKGDEFVEVEVMNICGSFRALQAPAHDGIRRGRWGPSIAIAVRRAMAVCQRGSPILMGEGRVGDSTISSNLSKASRTVSFRRQRQSVIYRKFHGNWRGRLPGLWLEQCFNNTMYPDETPKPGALLCTVV